MTVDIMAGIATVSDPATTDHGKRLDKAHTWRFLFCCPFTRSMLERAAERWREPLDADDLADIAGGMYLFEAKEVALQRYLRQWAADHPSRMAELIGNTPAGPVAAIAPIDHRGQLVRFERDPKG